MQNRSNKWIQTLGEDYRVESRAIVSGIEYPVSVPDTAEPSSVQRCRIKHQLFTSANLIGNACAGILEMSFIPTEAPPAAAQINLESRLIAEDGTATEWLPRGTYWIDERDDAYHGRLKVTAYDRMLFAEDDWFPDGVISGTWPKPAPDVVNIICERLGIELDSRTVLNKDIMVAVPIGKTLRNTLMEIAAAHGGNFTITPANRLRLVLLPEEIGITYLTDENENYVSDENSNYIVFLGGEYHNIQYQCGSYSRLGDIINVTGVELVLDSAHSYKAGSDGYLLTGECTFATETTPRIALNNLVSRPFMPFVANQVQLDPAAELGDRIMVAGDSSVVGAMVIDVSAAYLAEVSAPITGEVNHEIPFKNRTQQLIDRKVAEARAEIKVTTDSIVSTVEGLSGTVSKIDQKVNNITISVSNGTESSKIQLLVNGVVVASKTIRFTGDVVFERALRDGRTVISGDNILTGQILAEFIKLGGEMVVYESLDEDAEIGGYLGFIKSYNYDGYKTSGMAMTDPLGDVQIALTGDGARLSTPASEILAAYHAWVKTDHNIYLNADGYIYDSSGAAISSDRNAKENIQYDIEKYLPIFDKLKPCSFQYKGRSRQHLGFIAQDVEAAMIESLVDSEDFAALVIDNGKYSLRYSEFIPMLVAKIQQQEQRIAQLEGNLHG